MARVPTDVKTVFEPGNEVKVTLTMSRDTMEDIKNWLNDYSSMAGEPLTDMEAIQALFVVGDQFAEHRDWRDNVTVEKTSNGYDVCIDKVD
jgi:hypothetical protein